MGTLNQEKVTQEMAIADVTAWMDLKRIKPKRREALKNFVENMVDAVMDGELIFDRDSGLLKYRLINPVGEGEFLKELTFKPRISEYEMDTYRPSVKNISDPMLASTLLVLATLTGQSTAMLKQLDKSTDFPLCESIAIFFM